MKSVILPLIIVYTYILITCVVAQEDPINVVIVSCGKERRKEALASARSVLMTTKDPSRIHFHFVHDSDDENGLFFDEKLIKWKKRVDFDFSTYMANLPSEYYNLFAPCACQRLFLHDLLPDHVNKVLYIDSDTLILVDVGELWSAFERFEPETVAALAGEHEKTAQSAYYRDNAKHPYYKDGVYGLNSGVILLNLKSLRANPWNDEFEKYRQQYELVFHDQDLLNIYFGNHPERLHLLSCEWNYRHDHCFFSTQHCSSVKLLHGNRGTFHRGPEQYQYGVHAFVILFNAFSMMADADLGNCRGVLQSFMWNIRQLEGQQMTNYCDVGAVQSIAYRVQEMCQSNQDEL